MKNKSKKNIGIKTGVALSIFVVAIMISSVTALPVLNKASERLVSEKDIDENTILAENDEDLDEKKESLFNLLVEVLNNKDLREILRKEFNVRYLKRYSYKDIEKAYEKGLITYDSNDIDEMAKKFNKFLTKGKDLYQSISNFIKEDEEISASIKELFTDCEECNPDENDNSVTWYPGAYIICGWAFFVAACFYIPFIIGYPLYMLTGIIGSSLILPFVITFIFAESMGCFELYGIEFPDP